MKEKDKIVDLLLTKLELRDVLNAVTTIFQAEQDVSNYNKIKDIINDNADLLEQTQNIHSFFGIYWNTLIRSFIYNLNGELERLLKIRSEIISLWNKNYEIKEEYYYQYLFDLNNLMITYAKLNQQEKVFELLQKLEHEKPRNYFDQVWIFKRVAIKKLIYFMTKGAFNEALLLVPNIESGLKKYNLNIASKITLIINVSTLYYCIEDFQSCLKWANKIVNSLKSNLRLDAQRVIRLLGIIAQIELENDYETIDNFFRSTRRFFKKTGIKEKNQSESILLDYLWKYNDSNKSKQKDVLVNFKLEIEKMKNDKKLISMLGLDELYFWIRSKLEKKPMAQLIKESYNSGN